MLARRAVVAEEVAEHEMAAETEKLEAEAKQCRSEAAIANEDTPNSRSPQQVSCTKASFPSRNSTNSHQTPKFHPEIIWIPSTPERRHELMGSTRTMVDEEGNGCRHKTL